MTTARRLQRLWLQPGQLFRAQRRRSTTATSATWPVLVRRRARAPWRPGRDDRDDRDGDTMIAAPAATTPGAGATTIAAAMIATSGWMIAATATRAGATSSGWSSIAAGHCGSARLPDYPDYAASTPRSGDGEVNAVRLNDSFFYGGGGVGGIVRKMAVGGGGGASLWPAQRCSASASASPACRWACASVAASADEPRLRLLRRPSRRGAVTTGSRSFGLRRSGWVASSAIRAPEETHGGRGDPVHRKRLRYGWGSPTMAFRRGDGAVRASARRLEGAAPGRDQRPYPELSSDLRAAGGRPAVPAAMMSVTPYDRLTHSLGKSCRRSPRMFMRDVRHPPDLVAFPEDRVRRSRPCSTGRRANVAVIPFGGGSSVAGGVRRCRRKLAPAPVSSTCSTNGSCRRDRPPAAPRIQAPLGLELRGPAEAAWPDPAPFPAEPAALHPGRLDRRSGGPLTPRSTHTSTISVNPRAGDPVRRSGTRRLPRLRAPIPDRMIIGSEGILGVITEAWMRAAGPPVHQASASVDSPT